VSMHRGKRLRDEGGSSSEVAERTGGPAERPPRPRGRWRLVVVALVVFIVAFGAATARLFVWPERGMPARVSAIVMLGGSGDHDRYLLALQLAWQHRAPFVVISRDSPTYGHGSICAPPISHVHVICFTPDPVTTRGEAEFVGRLARKYHWRSVVLVTITPQDSRGRLRVERCFSGPVYVVTSSLPWSSWPYEIAYEWAATAKALVWQRSC
jgi:hypothetical protein